MVPHTPILTPGGTQQKLGQLSYADTLQKSPSQVWNGREWIVFAYIQEKEAAPFHTLNEKREKPLLIGDRMYRILGSHPFGKINKISPGPDSCHVSLAYMT